MSALIGIDIGTSSVKAVLVGEDGEPLASFGRAHTMVRDAPGKAEQTPDGWMALVNEALDAFAEVTDSVAAIGITSQVNTHVFCDASLTALHPALTWQDTRPGEDAKALDAQLDDEAKIAALGAPIPIDASHALSRMAWMARTHPAVWAKTAHVLSPKDFAIAHLTGQVSADPLASIGLTGMNLGYADAVLNLLPHASDVLPPLRDPVQVAGTVKTGPFAGTPVATGTMDAWAAMFGLGVAAEHEAMYLSGTSEVLGLISQARAGTPGIVTFPDWNGITLHAAPTQSGGASLAWLCNLLGQDINALNTLAAQATISAQSPLFLPHLEGERAPLWDATSRGGFAGLASATGPAELAACVMEGVAFSARLAIEALEKSGNHTITDLRHGGGGAKSDSWCQIRANVLGRNLHRVDVAEAGAQGAMVMASVAAGMSDSLQASTGRLVSVDRVFAPDPQSAELANKRYEQFKALYPALSPITQGLQAI